MIDASVDDSESPETRESIWPIDQSAPATEQQLELAALTEIVAVQAQALNDVINSANNLQARVAALEKAAHAKAAKSNGHGIISLS